MFYWIQWFHKIYVCQFALSLQELIVCWTAASRIIVFPTNAKGNSAIFFSYLRAKNMLIRKLWLLARRQTTLRSVVICKRPNPYTAIMSRAVTRMSIRAGMWAKIAVRGVTAQRWVRLGEVASRSWSWLHHEAQDTPLLPPLLPPSFTEKRRDVAVCGDPRGVQLEYHPNFPFIALARRKELDHKQKG